MLEYAFGIFRPLNPCDGVLEVESPVAPVAVAVACEDVAVAYLQPGDVVVACEDDGLVGIIPAPSFIVLGDTTIYPPAQSSPHLPSLHDVEYLHSVNPLQPIRAKKASTGLVGTPEPHLRRRLEG